MRNPRSDVSFAVIASSPLGPRENDWSNTKTNANWSHLLAMEVKVVWPWPGAARRPMSGSSSKAAGDLETEAPCARAPKNLKYDARCLRVQSPVNIGSMYTAYPSELAIPQKRRFTTSYESPR